MLVKASWPVLVQNFCCIFC